MKRFLPAVFVLVSILALHIFITTKIAHTGYRTAPIKKEAEKIRNENRELAARIAQKESLWKIEEKAAGKLKMEYPKRIKYIAASKEAKAGR